MRKKNMESDTASGYCTRRFVSNVKVWYRQQRKRTNTKQIKSILTKFPSNQLQASGTDDLFPDCTAPFWVHVHTDAIAEGNDGSQKNNRGNQGLGTVVLTSVNLNNRIFNDLNNFLSPHLAQTYPPSQLSPKCFKRRPMLRKLASNFILSNMQLQFLTRLTSCE